MDFKKFLRKLKKTVKTAYFFLHQLFFSIKKASVQCNICGFKANRFQSDSWHLYAICPRCQSGVRQRLLFQIMKHHDELNVSNLIKNKSVLHFAPENILRDVFKRKALLYKTADYFAEGYYYPDIDFDMDISSMQTINDSSYDCVIACDVLEHVYDHKNAIKEVNRILKNGGYCIFTVPQKDNLQVTIDDPSITDPAQRELKYGQSDHLRIYGNDFEDMIKQSGFELTVVDENYFSQEIILKHVLFPPVLSQHPLATNYRRVFFGKKII